MMCSGVSLTVGGVDYYGMLREIVEVSFYGVGLPHQKIFLFKCDQYDHVRGIKTHSKYGFVDIDSRKLWPTQEKFILASQAKQVYYTPYAVSSMKGRKAKRKNIWAVCPTRPRHFIDMSSVTAEQEVDDYFEDPLPPTVAQPIDDLSCFIVHQELAEQTRVAVDEEQENNEMSDEETENEEDGE